MGKAKRKPLASSVRGRKVTPASGEWLSRSQLALRGKIDRGTLARYLAMKGAPRPNDKMRFPFTRVMEFVRRVAPHAGTEAGGESRKLRERLLQIEVEEREHDLAVKRGRTVDKARIDPVLASMFGQLTEDLRSKFERELPMKCPGKTPVEIMQMNAVAIDWVLTRLKNGAEPITTS